jgi:hypothetical protein
MHMNFVNVQLCAAKFCLLLMHEINFKLAAACHKLFVILEAAAYFILQNNAVNTVNRDVNK